MTDLIRCVRHGVDVYLVTRLEAEEQGVPFGCPECTRAATEGRDVDAMTGDERGQEILDWLTQPLMTDFELVWKRIDALVGRGVWNHEMVDPDRLAAEARTQQHPSDLNAYALHTLEQLAGTKPVIVVHAEDL